ncbi:hypothetical protein MD484_g804, partial [Candolleomyces efflorescens]
MVLGSGPVQFDSSRVRTVKPGLGESQGYHLSPRELSTIFGIEGRRFGNLPSRMVIPVLEGRWYTENWYMTNGYLYLVEPQAWVPQIYHGETIPVSKFTTSHTTETKTVSERTFNAGTSASLDIEAGGSYYGVTASVKSSSSIEFKVSTSSTVTHASTTTGTTGDVPVHELMVYPILQCKVIKKQRIEYTINDHSDELKWGWHSYDDGFWDERRVADTNLSEVKKLAYHPVPMSGNGLPGKAYLLPVPQVTGTGDVEVTTLLSRKGWKDWYHYDVAWEDCNDLTIQVAVPNNSIAFRPMATWTILNSE